jgi:transcriptional regulator with XRE-family HTH domain
MQFIDRLEAKLQERNITKLELATQLDIRRPTLSEWKRTGGIPNAELAIKIADYLNVSVEWLITGKDKSGYTDAEHELILKIRTLSEANKNVVETFVNALYQQDSENRSNKLG